MYVHDRMCFPALSRSLHPPKCIDAIDLYRGGHILLYNISIKETSSCYIGWYLTYEGEEYINFNDIQLNYVFCPAGSF